MARYDDLNTKMIAYATVLSIVILVIVLQLTQALSYNMVNFESSIKEGNKSDRAYEAKREQLESLNGFNRVSVIDESAPPPGKGEEMPTKKVIRIPVEEAQKLILKEMAGSAELAPGT
jgi:hypothetical protein